MNRLKGLWKDYIKSMSRFFNAHAFCRVNSEMKGEEKEKGCTYFTVHPTSYLFS